LLTNPTDAANESLLRDVKAAAIGQQILVFEAATGREIDAAFENLVREKVDALFVAGGAFLSARRVQLAVLAARYAVPAAYSQRAFVAAGGLMSYGTNFSDTFRQVGLYGARILNGTKPMDLPVMQATKFELVINLNTARALRSDVPPTLLARADEVIEKVERVASMLPPRPPRPPPRPCRIAGTPTPGRTPATSPSCVSNRLAHLAVRLPTSHMTVSQAGPTGSMTPWRKS